MEEFDLRAGELEELLSEKATAVEDLVQQVRVTPLSSPMLTVTDGERAQMSPSEDDAAFQSRVQVRVLFQDLLCCSLYYSFL